MRPTKPFVAVLVTAGLLLCASGIAAAPEVSVDEEVPERTLLDNIKAGGLGAYVIILIAVAGAALVLALAVGVRRAALLPPLLVSQLEQALNSGDVDRARELCVRATRLRNVLFAGLARVDAGPEAAARAAHLALEKERIALRRNAGWLLLLAVLAVLVGAFSTVNGFMEFFDKVSLGGSISTYAYPDSYFKALIPCFMGLLVAVILAPPWWFFRGRAETLAHEIEITADDLISRVGTGVAGEEQAKT